MATRQTVKNAKAMRKPTSVAKKTGQRAPRMSRSATARSMAKADGPNDHERVRQVLSRYCFALDRGKMDELAPLFHRNAMFAVSFENGQTHTGRETIQAWYEKFFQQRPDQYRHMRHKIYEPLVTVTGNTATAATYFDADSIGPDDKIYVIAGRYDDTLIKEDGQWFFQNRTISVFYHYSPGDGQEGMQA